MSRGPGRWQRAVLELCANAPLDDDGIPTWVTVEAVAISVDEVQSAFSGQHLDRSRREGIRRAMRELDTAGKITASHRFVYRERERLTKQWYGTHEGRTGWWADYRTELVERSCLHARRLLTDDEAEREEGRRQELLKNLALYAQAQGMEAMVQSTLRMAKAGAL